MKRAIWGWSLVLSLALFGCDASDPGGSSTSGGGENAGGETAGGDGGGTSGDSTDGESTDGGGSSGSEAAGESTSLTPENTKIEFVGAHTDKEQPDRVGHFATFKGEAKVADGKLTAVEVDIDTDSITTDMDKLTGHLKTADFFEVNEFPKAMFKSTKIEDAGDGKVDITGDLTLLETTKSITFPATVSTDGGLMLESSFEIDRTEFGMDFNTDGIEKIVKLNVTVGK